MTSERIKEIQEQTAYPNSRSVQQALLQVWNECQQEHNKQLSIHSVVKQSEQFNCYEMHASSRFAGCNKQCKECLENEKSKAI